MTDIKIMALLHECIESSLEDERQMRFSEVHDALEFVQSPIEAKLLCAMAFMETPLIVTPGERAERPFILINGKCNYRIEKLDQWVAIEMQAPVLSYCADFLVTAKFYGSDTHYKVVVECDGHDFHERTKEQASRDKRRDREMLSAGYRVVRFTGSEIHRNPMGCAAEVAKLISAIEWEARPE